MKNLDIPKIYVINLESSLERRESIKLQMEKYSLRYEFFRAVDKDLLSEEHLKKHDAEIAKEEFGRPLKVGEIACALSHYSIHEKMLRENIERAIIFEDDIVINEDTVEIMKCLSMYPENLELLYLFHGKAKSFPWKRKTIYKHYKMAKYRVPSKNSKRTIMYAAAYLLTRKGAEKLLLDAYPLKLPIDIHMGYIQRNNLVTYGIEPCCLQLGDFETTIPDRFN